MRPLRSPDESKAPRGTGCASGRARNESFPVSRGEASISPDPVMKRATAGPMKTKRLLLSCALASSCAPPPTEPEAPSVSSQSTRDESPAPTLDEDLSHRGLSAAICPPGPYPTVGGEYRAETIERTSPKDLDSNDMEFHLYEGPVWLDSGLYFSDFRTSEGFPSRILRYVPGQALTVALSDSGTNGLGLDRDGASLLGARHSSRSIVRFSSDLSQARNLVEGYQGKRFNSPNDVAMRSDGNFYFTDPDFQSGGDRDLSTTSVYWVNPQGQASVIDDSITNPNGISISPDERFLFVAGNMEQGFLKRYPLDKDGRVGDGSIVLSDVTVPDGMVFDCASNLYVTEHTQRRIRIVTMDGTELGRIEGFEMNVTNVAFGGSDRKTLYVTMTGGLSRVDLPVVGLPY